MHAPKKLTCANSIARVQRSTHTSARVARISRVPCFRLYGAMGSSLGTSSAAMTPTAALNCRHLPYQLTGVGGSYLQSTPHSMCCFTLGKLCLTSATKELHLWCHSAFGEPHPPTHPLKVGIFRTSDLRCMPPSTTCCRAMAGWMSSPCSRRCGRTTPPPLGTSGDAPCDEGRLGVAQKRHHKMWDFSKHPLQWADVLLGSLPR